MVKIRIAAVGDIQLGDQVLCFGFGIRSTFKNNYNNLIRDSQIRKILQNADIISGNYECSYDEYDELTFSINNLSANREAIQFLNNCGFNLLNLANNHTLERGEQGLNELLKSLESMGIHYTGLKGGSFLFNYKGKIIAFMNYSAIHDYKNNETINIWDDNELGNICTISKKVDLVIVNIHWGYEFINQPFKTQILLGHKLIDNGVHIVLGHHPHVIQPIEKYKNGIIAYSLGNFIFDGIYSKNANNSMILLLDIDLKNINIDYTVIPIRINKDYSLEINNNDNRVINIVNQPATDIPVLLYNKSVLRLRKKYRLSVLKHIIVNIFKYRNKRMIFRWIFRRITLIMKNRKNEINNPSDVYLWEKE
jgi:gamma-polyglutamate biosynthesis protein CapA